MLPIVKLLSALVITPGAIGTYFLVLKQFTPKPEHIGILLSKAKNLGNCKLGLVQNASQKTGGFIENAENTELDQGDKDKLKQLFEFFEKSETNKDEIKKITDACKNGEIVELAGKADTGHKDTNTGNEHKPAT